MTQDMLLTVGEEYFVTESVDGSTLRVGLYNDSTDDLDEGSTGSDITTEPDNDNYDPVEVTFSARNIDGNWGVENDTEIEFDFSDNVEGDEEVDTAYVEVNFDSTEAGSTGYHLIANPSLSQTRGIGSIDTLNIFEGDIELKLE